MKHIPFEKFDANETAEKTVTVTTADLLMILARSHDGRGPTTEDILLLADLRHRISECKDKDYIAVENAEHATLVQKLNMARWPMEGDAIARFIRSVKAPIDPDVKPA